MSCERRRKENGKGIILSRVKIGKKRFCRYRDPELDKYAATVQDNFVREHLELKYFTSREAEKEVSCANEGSYDAVDEAVDPKETKVSAAELNGMKIAISADVEAVNKAETLPVTTEGASSSLSSNKVHYYVPADVRRGKSRKRNEPLIVVAGIQVDLKHYFHCSFCHNESDDSALIVRDTATFTKLARQGKVSTTPCMHELSLPGRCRGSGPTRPL